MDNNTSSPFNILSKAYYDKARELFNDSHGMRYPTLVSITMSESFFYKCLSDKESRAGAILIKNTGEMTCMGAALQRRRDDPNKPDFELNLKLI